MANFVELILSHRYDWLAVVVLGLGMIPLSVESWFPAHERFYIPKSTDSVDASIDYPHVASETVSGEELAFFGKDCDGLRWFNCT